MNSNPDRLRYSQIEIRLESFIDINNDILQEKDDKNKIADNGFYFDRISIKCFCCNFLYPNHNQSCAFIKEKEKEQKNLVISKYTGIKKSLLFEKERKKTFIEWPIPDVISPSDLAKDGFIYSRKDDTVICIYCYNILSEWKTGDNVRNRHRKKEPKCSYINNCPVGNVTLEESEIADELIKPDLDENEIFNNGFQECNYPLKVCEEIGSDINLTVIKKDDEGDDEYFKREYKRMYEIMYCRNFPLYRSFTQFEEWPNRVGITPFEFSSAGFFYFGVTDHVMCSICGIIIRNWVYSGKSNIPKIAHMKLNPNCPFIKLAFPNENTQFCYDDFYYNNNRSLSYIQNPSIGNDKISDDELNIIINEFDAFKSFFQTERSFRYPIELLRYILRKKIQKTGSPFYRDKNEIYQDLAIFEHQNQMFVNFNNEYYYNDNDFNINGQALECMHCCGMTPRVLLPCHHLIYCLDCIVSFFSPYGPASPNFRDKVMCKLCGLTTHSITKVIPVDKEIRCIYCDRTKGIYVFLPCRHAKICKICAPKLIEKNKFPLTCPVQECQKESYYNFELITYDFNSDFCDAECDSETDESLRGVE